MRTWRQHPAAMVNVFALALTFGLALGATEEAPTEVETPVEKLRHTLQGLRTLAKAIDGYSIDHNLYPQPKCEPHSSGLNLCSAYALGRDLKVYTRGTSAADGWGNPYLYWHTPDGMHYAVVSTGSDGALDDEGRLQEVFDSCIAQIEGGGFVTPSVVDCFESDLVWCDGQGLVISADVVRTCR